MATLNFFAPPRWTVQVDHSENLIALMTMLVLALVINRLVSGMRRATATVHLNEQGARQLQCLVLGLCNAVNTQEVQHVGRNGSYLLRRMSSANNSMRRNTPAAIALLIAGYGLN